MAYLSLGDGKYRKDYVPKMIVSASKIAETFQLSLFKNKGFMYDEKFQQITLQNFSYFLHETHAEFFF